MKKTLLAAIVALATTGAFAQSKTTGSVTLTTGMTAKVDLNNDTSTATLTLTGPQDRWIALQFGSFTNTQGMATGMDMVYYNGTTLVDCHMNGEGATPITDTNDWTVTSNTVSGSTRTIVATRAFTGGTGDYTFVYSNTDIDFAWAKGSSASYTLSNHGSSNRGYKINQSFSCMPPDAPTAVAQSFCSGATVASLAATGGSGASFSWYTNSTGGTALASTTALSSGNYYVSQTLSACESARTQVAVTVTSVPVPTAATAQAFCNAATVADLTATGQAGATIIWYGAETEPFALESTTVLTNGGTYYVGQTQGDCSSQRLAVNVTINTTAAPGAAAQSFCGSATVSELSAIGTAVKWYTTQGGTALAPTAALSTGTYYATQTLNNCESATTAVDVMVSAIPNAPTGAATQTFTAGETVADLMIGIAVGADVQWYVFDEDVYVAIESTTALVDGMTYYVSQEVNNCASSYLAVTVTQVAGTDSFGLAGLKAYPNPAANAVTVSAGTSIANVSVHNILGQQVLVQSANGASTTLNLSALTAGTYLVKVTSDKGATATLRVVKQ